MNDHDYLRAAGIHITDEQLTREKANLDQFRAEADHLIDHALTARHTDKPAEASAQVLAITGHIQEHVRRNGNPTGLLTTLIFRAAMIADSLVTCDAKLQQMTAERDEALAALAAAESGRSKWWRP